MDSSEATLVARARVGDATAFDALVQRHSDRLYATLRSFGLSSEEAEEVAQEVFVRAWRGLHRFESRSQLSTWLYRIAYNEAQRRRSRRLRAGSGSEIQLDELVLRLPAAETASPESRILKREFLTELRDALSQLPEEWRRAVVLRDIEGLGTEEAAAACGVGEAALKSRLHRGRMQLRATLAPYLDAPG